MPLTDVGPEEHAGDQERAWAMAFSPPKGPLQGLHAKSDKNVDPGATTTRLRVQQFAEVSMIAPIILQTASMPLRLAPAQRRPARCLRAGARPLPAAAVVDWRGPARLARPHPQRPVLDFGKVEVGASKTLYLELENATAAAQVRRHTAPSRGTSGPLAPP